MVAGQTVSKLYQDSPVFILLSWLISFQDDANHDPQWSDEQLESAQLKVGNITVGKHEIEIIRKTSLTVFEIIEKAWASVNCSLIDMKIEFGVTEEGDTFHNLYQWNFLFIDKWIIKIYVCQFLRI